jgi:uncharacterized membrane protein YeaQ/YmgE (transglycosylase-associated protein family)
MALLWLILIGAFAGWLAGQFIKGHGLDLVGEVILGVIAAFVGSYFVRSVGVDLGGGLIGSLIMALIGAIILLFVTRLFTRRRAWS